MEQPLEANVLVLEDQDGPFYLVAIDALYGGALGTQISAGLGCPADRVLVMGSHTHFAPGVDPDLETLGEAAEVYVSWVATQVVDAITRADGTDSAQVGYGESTAEGLFMNRRLPVLGRRLTDALGGPVRMAPNPRGDVDDIVRVVDVRVGDRTVAVLWGASCHPVCAPDPSKVNSAFPGVVRDAIRDRVGDHALPVLFLQGFSGDVRPASVEKARPRSLRQLLQSVVSHGRRFSPQEESAYKDWCSSLGESVLDALARARRSPEDVDISLNARRRQPEGWGRGVSATRIGLSESIQIVAVNAEVMSSQVGSLRHIAPHVIPAGCADEVIGYWPTDQMVREGGYEGCHSRQHFPALEWDGGADLLWDQMIEGL